jgi:putative restriction endonuclease
MSQERKLWTRDELILVMNLYCKLPFGKLHQGRPEVRALAELIGRTPGAVAFKLVNFASLDPDLQARGIRGATNISNLDREIWKEFSQNWETLPYESEKLLAGRQNKALEEILPQDEQLILPEGRSREALVKVRVNQSFFRKMVLASYRETCCITGIRQPELLIAGHIKPWSLDPQNRVNPQNGIAINALHDKAFENGLITITTNYTVKVSTLLKSQNDDASVRAFFLKYENQRINLPDRFLPAREFLEYHNNECFKN